MRDRDSNRILDWALGWLPLILGVLLAVVLVLDALAFDGSPSWIEGVLCVGLVGTGLSRVVGQRRLERADQRG